MKNPLYYIGEFLVHGISKTVDIIDTRGDQLLFVCLVLIMLSNVIRAFIVAPIVTGVVVGAVVLAIVSIYTYLKTKD